MTDIKLCDFCNMRVDSSVAECPSCGSGMFSTPVEGEVRCPGCGEMIKPDKAAKTTLPSGLVSVEGKCPLCKEELSVLTNPHPETVRAKREEREAAAFAKRKAEFKLLEEKVLKAQEGSFKRAGPDDVKTRNPYI